MTRIIASIVIAIVLSGCAAFKEYQNPVTPDSFKSVQNSYGVALALFDGYRDACAKREIPPSCRIAVPKMQRYIRVAEATRTKALAFIIKNPTISAATLVRDFSDAVNDFKVAQMEAGIK